MGAANVSPATVVISPAPAILGARRGAYGARMEGREWKKVVVVSAQTAKGCSLDAGS